MKKLLLILGICLAFLGLRAQEAPADSLPSDSAIIAALSDELEHAWLEQANLRMELDQLRLASSADSARRTLMRQRIDSLRATTQGACVVVDGDTLFFLYANCGGLTPAQRAKLASETIEKLGRNLSLRPDSVRLDDSDIFIDMMYGPDLIVTFTDRDALWAACPRDSLAAATRAVVVEKLRELHQEHGLWSLVKRGLMLLFAIIATWLVFNLIVKGYRMLCARIEQLRHTHLKPFCIQKVELLDTNKQVAVLLFLARMLKYVLMAVTLLLMIPLVFSIFPQTEALAWRIVSYIWDPFCEIVREVVAYIPNLFTIIVICVIVKYLVRLVKYFAVEIHNERIQINGFFPDWAMPTFYIIRFLLYAFMVAMIYPYLPGSRSGVFQGISVFLGLIVSFGSSSVIGNLIAGLVITYMRPFRMGDYIEVSDTVGNVIEKTPFVTRVRTPKNEVVTIPNSFIMSNKTVNYSQSAQQYGLIIHTEVSFHYKVPWREVNKALIEAALNTPGVVDDPRPFVLETSLGDCCPMYQLNAYIRDANRLLEIYSDLHENIQEAFKRAGLDMTTPGIIITRPDNANAQEQS